MRAIATRRVAKSISCRCSWPPARRTARRAARSIPRKSWRRRSRRFASTDAGADFCGDWLLALQADRGNQLDEGGEYLRVAGDDPLPEQVVRVAFEIPHQAAGLAHDQAAGGDVPGLESDLEESVVAAAACVAKVERGGAGPAHRGRALDQDPEQPQVVVEIVEAALRKAGTDQCLVEPRPVRYPDPAIVQEGATAAGRGEEFVAVRIVDQALGDHAALGERDRDRVLWHAMDEVGRAVERIDDPDVLGLLDRRPLLARGMPGLLC